jgi:hypothetical protein
MSSRVPLLQSQIDAADRIYLRTSDWQAKDTALKKLREALPGFGCPSANICKILALNHFSSTNLQRREIDTLGEHL